MSTLYEDVNGRNVTYCPVSEIYKKYILSLTYGVVFMFGLGLNGTLLCLLCGRTRRWSCSLIFLVNLAVADLLYVLTLPLLLVSYAMEDKWPFGDFACKAVRFLFYANLHCSMMFLMCISVHRFLGVCYPIRAMTYKTKRTAVLVSASVWILVAVEILPTFAFAHTGLISNITVCFDMTSPGDFHRYLPYGLFLTVIGFFIPLVVISICCCSMVRALVGGQYNIQVGQQMRTKSARTIVMVCLLFVICFVPYHITRTVYLLVRTYLISNCQVLNGVMLAYKIWRPIVSFNSCINPILYFTCSNRQRRVLFGQLCKKKVHPSVCTVQASPRDEQPYARRATPSGKSIREELQGSYLTIIKKEGAAVLR
ncbi:P2Y purinoceptor 6-like [Scleropages formosus]|uniref:P2Y purinoceptor 6-like n=1 Tax=Scleropages formosus TaxID=113540 RepID=UPI000879173C|nr:P2Y purinoceptor 6-like [Scleropages formosus]